jgi:small-conductance mechanosensitive channel
MALIAIAISALVRRRFDLSAATMGWPAYLRLAARALIDNFAVLIFILLVIISRVSLEASSPNARTYLLVVANSLATAWVVIVVLTSLIRNQFINRIVAITAWTIAALSILGLLDRTTAALDSRALLLGGIRVTPLLILKTTALLLIAIWAATAASNFLERRVQASSDLTPSVQVLLGKLIRIAMIALAIVVVLSASGIDLSVLAVLTGAIYLFTRSIVMLGAGRAAVFPTLVPPFVLLIGWLALGIVPTASQLIGLLIVLLGFRLTQRN